MKNLFILLLLATTFSACQQDLFDVEEARAKADQFLTGPQQNWENTFIPSTAGQFNDITPAMSSALSVKFGHRISPWQEGIAAMDELINPILASTEELDIYQRHDLESLTNSAMAFLGRAPMSDERTEVAARYLTNVLERSTPVDWHLLTDLYIFGQDRLTQASKKNYRKYIIEGALRTVESDRPDDVPVSRHNISEWQARIAIQALGTD